MASVTDDAQSLAEAFASGVGMTPEEALASPHSLVGTVDQIVEKMQRLRSELGITYFTWDVGSIDEMAPVIAALR